MADQGITIEVRDGVVYLSGYLNENADLMPLLGRAEPLVLNLRQVGRINSTGIRNLLRFLIKWGDRQLVYQECPCDFIDQVSMIPALLGQEPHHYGIESLFIPFECRQCGYDGESMEKLNDVEKMVGEKLQLAGKICPQCGSPLFLISEAYLVFMNRE